MANYIHDFFIATGVWRNGRAFTDEEHNRDCCDRRHNAILMRGRPAHPQMERSTADGVENPEFVRQWQEMNSFEFLWRVLFEEIPENSPLRTATDWQFLTASQVVREMSADIAADAAQDPVGATGATGATGSTDATGSAHQDLEAQARRQPPTQGPRTASQG